MNTPEFPCSHPERIITHSGKGRCAICHAEVESFAKSHPFPGGGEEWLQLGETCEEYALTDKEMKHRIRSERRIEDRRKGGDGQEGGNHYRSKVDPWELQREMKSSGDAFVDARRADAIKYAWRMKGDKNKLLEDLKKARHCIDAAITQLQNAHE